MPADLEWKVIYVGSASGPQYDQELEDVVVGPVPVGLSKFVLSTPPPDPKLVPEDDLLGATVVLICCSYKGQEFIRVGYWINNTYGEALPEGEYDWCLSRLTRAASGGERAAEASSAARFGNLQVWKSPNLSPLRKSFAQYWQTSRA
jgi:ASF1 like histone chaperone